MTEQNEQQEQQRLTSKMIEAEIAKLIAETGKLNAEVSQMAAENRKLAAETNKINSENRYYPVYLVFITATATLAVVGVVAGAVAAAFKFLS